MTGKGKIGNREKGMIGCKINISFFLKMYLNNDSSGNRENRFHP